MKIDKAIEIKERTGDEFLHTDPDEIDEAESLSIEALKRIKHARDFGSMAAVVAAAAVPLPGETRE